MRKISGLILLTVIVALGGYFWLRDPSSIDAHSKTKPAVFNKQQYSLSSPSSPWVIVNKQRPLNPRDFVPNNLVVPSTPLRLSSSDSEMDLQKPAASALAVMFAAAKKQGIDLMLASGYRSYTEQVTVYNSEVQAYGKARADSESARPGYSEHQTGLAADLEPTSRNCEVTDCFANTPEGKWLAANSYKFGFVLRYPEGKESVTGYRYEAWHVRFVGTALATEMHRDHIATLEEFFGLPAAADYQS